MTASFGLVSVAEMRALEAAAIASGSPEALLQERAGRAVAEVVTELSRPRDPVVVLAGAGNNGRDAVVAARYLAARDRSVQLYLWPKHALSSDELASLPGARISVSVLSSPDAGDLRRALAESGVVVDGLLGVGARGPMRADMAAVAELVNGVRSTHPSLRVVAVDVPSGLDADTGAAPGAVISADATVTFGAVKTGLLRFPGAELAGRLVTSPIGIPVAAVERLPVRVLDESAIRSSLPARPLNAHKYTLGRVLVVAGSATYVGAAYLCSAAAARSGCGLVALASDDPVKQVLAARLPEATYPLSPVDRESDPEGTAGRVADALAGYQALLIGPGIGRSSSTERFLHVLLTANAHAARPVPVVADADALAILATWPDWWHAVGPGHVLTPHAAEMARLTGLTVAAIADRPWDVARSFAERWRQVVVLKGPFTAVGYPDGTARVYPRANPALATAGTGDVLAGICAGLVAQGVTPSDAAGLAVVTHALAGRQLIERRGWRSLLASDLLEMIPLVLAGFERIPGAVEV